MTDHSTLKDLAHIRGLMDRSTRFLSLSGLSGVVAGLVALVGAYLARGHYLALQWGARTFGYGPDPTGRSGDMALDHVLFLLADGMGVLLVALLGAFWFTWRRSRRMGITLWDRSARRLMINLMLPLVAGGGFCLALLFHGQALMVPSATLVFYGLALLNASKYTLDEIRWLGISEMLLGIIASFWIGAGLLFWALGFGVLHIFYGAVMYLRHERGTVRTDV